MHRRARRWTRHVIEDQNRAMRSLHRDTTHLMTNKTMTAPVYDPDDLPDDIQDGQFFFNLDGELMYQIEGVMYSIPDVTNVIEVGGGQPAIPIVTSLPATPEDGDEIYYRHTATIMWHFKYSSEITSDPYKWLCLGGPFLDKNDGAAVTTASTSTVELPTGIGTPALTVPLAGVWEANYGAMMVHSLTSGQCLTELYYNGVGPLCPAVIKFGVGDASVAASYPIIITSAGNLLKHQYRTNGATGTFFGRWMTIRPMRVG